jgi:hypothetical protein
MKIVAYKIIGDLVIISIIPPFGKERKYVAKTFSHRVQRIAKVISKMYVESNDKVRFDLYYPQYDVVFGVAE